MGRKEEGGRKGEMESGKSRGKGEKGVGRRGEGEWVDTAGDVRSCQS